MGEGEKIERGWDEGEIGRRWKRVGGVGWGGVGERRRCGGRKRWKGGGKEEGGWGGEEWVEKGRERWYGGERESGR